LSSEECFFSDAFESSCEWEQLEEQNKCSSDFSVLDKQQCQSAFPEINKQNEGTRLVQDINIANMSA
jgi:hypothetical protein